MLMVPMTKTEKVTTYFMEPGSENTDDIVDAVARRFEESDIKTVVVASTSGRTGVKFAEALRGKAEVIAVSHERMQAEFKERIAKLGGTAVDETHLPLHERGMDDVRRAFYTLGQGFKVAIEVILIASDRGLVEPYRDVIAIGGTGRGSDTAIIARSTNSKDIFSGSSSRKLEIREILAMPLKKRWWA